MQLSFYANFILTTKDPLLSHLPDPRACSWPLLWCGSTAGREPVGVSSREDGFEPQRGYLPDLLGRACIPLEPFQVLLLGRLPALALPRLPAESPGGPTNKSLDVDHCQDADSLPLFIG